MSGTRTHLHWCDDFSFGLNYFPHGSFLDGVNVDRFLICLFLLNQTKAEGYGGDLR